MKSENITHTKQLVETKQISKLIRGINFVKKSQEKNVNKNIFNSTSELPLKKGQFYLNSGHADLISKIYPLKHEQIFFIQPKGSPDPIAYAVLSIPELVLKNKFDKEKYDDSGEKDQNGKEKSVHIIHFVSEQLKNDISGVKNAKMMMTYTDEKSNDYKTYLEIAQRRANDVRVNYLALERLLLLFGKRLLNKPENSDLKTRIEQYREDSKKILEIQTKLQNLLLHLKN